MSRVTCAADFNDQCKPNYAFVIWVYMIRKLFSDSLMQEEPEINGVFLV
jgi:hypothetical protein